MITGTGEWESTGLQRKAMYLEDFKREIISKCVWCGVVWCVCVCVWGGGGGGRECPSCSLQDMV